MSLCTRNSPSSTPTPFHGITKQCVTNIPMYIEVNSFFFFGGGERHSHNTRGVHTNDRLSNMQVLSNLIIAQQ